MKLQKYIDLEGAVERLSERGYIANFKLIGNKMKCMDPISYFGPKDIQIIEFHRFESYDQEVASSLVFALECVNGTKGILISKYDRDVDMELISFMNQVKMKSSGKMTSSNN